MGNQKYNLVGILIGLGVGIALAVALDNIAVGVGIGAGVGTIFFLASNRKDQSDDQD
jgi:hypothetical protein